MRKVWQCGSAIAGVALVVAIIALIVGLVALKRPDVVNLGFPSNFEERVSIIAARARSEARLNTVKAELLAQEGYDDAAQQVQEIRADLRVAYENAKLESKQEWIELDKELEQLEMQIREQSADALLTLENLLARLRAEIRTDD